jgi:galactokinase
MGGGFGGCTINLIKKGMKTESKNNFVTLFWDLWNRIKIYDVKIGNGITL